MIIIFSDKHIFWCLGHKQYLLDTCVGSFEDPHLLVGSISQTFESDVICLCIQKYEVFLLSTLASSPQTISLLFPLLFDVVKPFERQSLLTSDSLKAEHYVVPL
jgi:hypothetical protein